MIAKTIEEVQEYVNVSSGQIINDYTTNKFTKTSDLMIPCSQLNFTHNFEGAPMHNRTYDKINIAKDYFNTSCINPKTNYSLLGTESTLL